MCTHIEYSVCACACACLCVCVCAYACVCLERERERERERGVHTTFSLKRGSDWHYYLSNSAQFFILAVPGLSEDLKTAIVKTLLKKPSLDKNLLKNYRPISNLPFLSKILEKVILHKLLSHFQENNLSNPFQSAYQAGHSTETVLLHIL